MDQQFSNLLLICLISLSKVTCDAPQHCCQNGNQGCEGKCIPEGWIDDGEKDCDDGSDEKGTWSFLCTIKFELQH